MSHYMSKSGTYMHIAIHTPINIIKGDVNMVHLARFPFSRYVYMYFKIKLNR